MIKVDITIGTDQITPMLARIKRELANYPEEALLEFKQLTPKRSGHARRNTRLTGDKHEIRADYPYAERLDQGWSKIQAPDGMTRPFLKWSQRRIKQIFRNTP